MGHLTGHMAVKWKIIKSDILKMITSKIQSEYFRCVCPKFFKNLIEKEHL